MDKLQEDVRALLMRASTRWPMVMREGMAWGLMMRSGTMPSAVQGMSSCVYVIPIVPFCPCRLANLSPTCGMRIDRTCAPTSNIFFLLVMTGQCFLVATD